MQFKRILPVIVLGAMLTSCSENQSQFDINEGWNFWSENNQSVKIVNLPHDAMLAESRSADEPSGSASSFFKGGVYHYEKTITADKNMVESHVTISLGGVYSQSRVYVNGLLAGSCDYGYTGYDVCLDGLLKEGENTICIEAENNTPNTRWYSGAGVYRPLKLTVQNAQAYIEDVKVTTLCIAPATIRVQSSHKNGEIQTRVLYKGKEIATYLLGDDVTFTIDDAKLWSAESPELYTLEQVLYYEGKLLDKKTVDFGIRSLSVSAQTGLLVNGKQVLLKGGCLHHDNGVLGAAEYQDAAYRKVAILKSYGFNAIRSSHDPLSEEMLKACDELGMYVMDELWDMWYQRKTKNDYGNYFENIRPDGSMTNWEFDQERFVKKDYNHPSVIMYSIGNEVSEPVSERGLELEKKLVDNLHRLDASRPVTCGMNLMIQLVSAMGGSIFNPDAESAGSSIGSDEPMSSDQYNAMVQQNGQGMLQAVLVPAVDQICSPGLDLLDIAGYNYGHLRYPIDASLHPDRVMVGTETYPHTIATCWDMVESIPSLVGDFMWTAWDYLGEGGIGAWEYKDAGENHAFTKDFPYLLAGSGALDILGNPTGEAFRAKAVWAKDDEPYLTVSPIFPGKTPIKSIWRESNSRPSWSYPGYEGEIATVEVFTTAPEVELYLNGDLVAKKAVANGLATFEVAYAPGELKAVSISSDGTKHQTSLVSATGEPQISIIPEKESYRAGELIFLDIDITGENGQVISNDDRILSVKVEGGELLGFGSARERTEERFLEGKYSTYFGHSQAVVRAPKQGKVSVTVSGEGLKSKSVSVKVAK